MKIYRIFTILLVIYIFYFLFKIIDWRIFLVSLVEANIFYLSLGFIISLLLPILSFLRWQKILNEFGYKTYFIKLMKIILLSFSANLFAPAKSGDLVKIFAHTNIKKKSNLFSGLILDRFCDLIILSLLSIFGGFYLKNSTVIVLGLLIISTLLFAIILNKFIKFSFKTKILNKIYLIVSKSFQLFFNRSKNIVFVILLSLLQWFFASIQVWLFYLAFGANISLVIVFSLFPVVVFLSFLPITPSGLGVREILFVYLFSQFVFPHISLAVSVSYYISVVILPGLIGFTFLIDFFKKIDMKKFVKLKKEFKIF